MTRSRYVFIGISILNGFCEWHFLFLDAQSKKFCKLKCLGLCMKAKTLRLLKLFLTLYGKLWF